MTEIKKEGYIGYYGRGPHDEKSWLSRYLILFGTSSKQQPRLDIYPKLPTQPAEDQQGRISIYLQFIDNISQISEEKQKFVLKIDSSERLDPYLIATHDQSDLQEWCTAIQYELDAIREHRASKQIKQKTVDADVAVFSDGLDTSSLEQDATFKVKPLDGSDSVLVAKLDPTKTYNLVIRGNRIEIHNAKDELMTNCTWPFMFIRRYGKNNNQFTIEAGRKCSLGVGLFSFVPISRTSEDIFREVQIRLKEKSSQENIPKNQRSASTTNVSPPLSVRPSHVHSRPRSRPDQASTVNTTLIHPTHSYSNTEPNVRPNTSSERDRGEFASDSYNTMSPPSTATRQHSSHSNTSTDEYYSVPSGTTEADDNYCDPRNLESTDSKTKLSSKLDDLKDEFADEEDKTYDHIDFQIRGSGVKPIAPQRPEVEVLYGELSTVKAAGRGAGYDKNAKHSKKHKSSKASK